MFQKILRNRDVGRVIRAETGVDKLEDESDHVEIIIPEYVISINTSFFLGFLGPSVRKLGKDLFEDLFTFTTDNQDIVNDIEEGIRRSLMEAGMEHDHELLKFFAYDHLPEELQKVSKPFKELAVKMLDELGDTKYDYEVNAFMRKLLEAKDCVVRAKLGLIV